MLHNRGVTVQEWLRTEAGLWWWPANGPASLIEWMGITATSHAVNSRVCVIPRSAPLLEALTPTTVCRIFASLCGMAPTPAEIRAQLRTLEMPDARMESPVRNLDLLHRTQTWMTMARLVKVDVLVLVEPMASAPTKHQRQVTRLLQEAVAFHRHILIVTPHSESASAMGALNTPPMDRLRS